MPLDADSWFYIVERKKDQINAGGYKVWPRRELRARD